MLVPSKVYLLLSLILELQAPFQIPALSSCSARRLLRMLKLTKGGIGSQSIIIRIQHCIETHCVCCVSLVIVGCGEFSANCTLIPILVILRMWHCIL